MRSTQRTRSRGKLEVANASAANGSARSSLARARATHIPPRPSSIPPRSEPPSADGLVRLATAPVHFRAARLNAADLPPNLTYRAQCDGTSIGPLALVDLGATGFSAATPPRLALLPGATLERFELLLEGDPIWAGKAVVVHANEKRFGARFTSGLVDLAHVRLNATIEEQLATLRAQRAVLPADWRAAVGDVRQLLENMRRHLNDVERESPEDPLHRTEDEWILFHSLRERWGTAYYGAIAHLHEQSKQLADESLPLAHSYASTALMPLLSACPMHRRAYEKPLGYAGDFRLMELYFARELSGEGLFGRFLHSLAQGHSLGRTVVAREAFVRSAVRSVAEVHDRRRARILSVGAGPAIELRKLLGDIDSVGRPLEIILVDQDEAAHEVAHRRLTRILVEQHQSRLPVKFECLTFSVRQLIKPWTVEERRVVDVTLANLDFVYTSGLYDYLNDAVAARLTKVLYSRLRPGGRLLVGNLVETPDTTWIMQYVLGWDLVYRSERSMLELARGLDPIPSRVGLSKDGTGRCLFLDITRPALRP